MALKGHLLLEAELNGLVETHLKNPGALKEARLTFHHKLCLTRAILPEGVLDREWEAAQLLNRLRNKLAHNLEAEDVDAIVRKFLATLEDPDVPEEEWADETLDKRFKRCLALLCGVVSGVRAMAEAINVGASSTAHNKAMQTAAASRRR